MPGNVSKEVTRERERRAWELRQACWTQERIAGDLGVDRSTISKMLARIDRRLLKQVEAAVFAMKVAEDARLEFIIDEAMQAWQRSKSPAVAKRVTKTKAGEKDPGETEGEGKHGGRSQETVSQAAQCGDARYLVEARAAMADRRKLWGLDAPQKVAQTNAKGEDLRLDDLADVFRKAKDWAPEKDAKAGVQPSASSEAPAAAEPLTTPEPTE